MHEAAVACQRSPPWPPVAVAAGKLRPSEMIDVPRARLNGADGETTEWKSQTLRAYQHGARSLLTR